MRSSTGAMVIALLAVSLSGCFGEPEDEDGLTADAERDGWTVTIKKADGTTESRDVTSDPHKEDTDGDGLDDFQEMIGGTDPRNPDTDGDGLKEGPEVELRADSALAKAWIAQGLVHESRGDQIWFPSERTHQANPLEQDSDEDGLLDGEEVAGVVMMICGKEQTIRTSPRQPDSDNDFILDPDEIALGTNATSRDTDGDGAPDLTDVEPCGDLWVRFEALTFELSTSDASGPFEIQGWFDGDAVPWSTGMFDAAPGAPVDLEEHVETLDVDDAQGNLRDRDFNVTLTIIIYSGGESDRRTLAITESGASEAVFHFDARTGHLALAGEGPGADATAESSGPDGSVRVSLKAQIGP